MLALLALAASSVTQCPVERAHYTLRHHPEWSARFRVVDSGPEWPGGIALAVHNRKSGETFWWLPSIGGTAGLQYVTSTEDVTAKGWAPPNPDGGPRPYGDRQYLGFDAAYDLIDGVPRRGRRAPAHMLFPDSAGSHDTAFEWKDFFDLDGCSTKSR